MAELKMYDAQQDQGAITCLQTFESRVVIDGNRQAGITGKYFVNRRMERSAPDSYNQMVAERLWQLSAEMAGMQTGDTYGSRIDR